MQKEVDPKLLIIPDNRKNDDVSILMESIKSQGMIHPPIVREDNIVVVGIKRVLAAIKLNLITIKIETVPSDLEEETYKILSLHENLKRHNLQWYDQVIMEKQLHEIRQEEHGEGQKGKKIGWSLRDTAAELEMSFGTLSEDIRLADAVLADPTLRNIQDKTTAKKLIFSAIKRYQQEFDSALPTDIPVNCIHHGESSRILEIYKDNSIDVCITDPPWQDYKDKALTRDQHTIEVFKQVYRVLKAPGFLYAFIGTSDWFYYTEELPKFGFNMQRWPLIWIKEGGLSYTSAPWQYQRDYELIIYGVKGAPSLAAGMISAIMSHSVVPSSKLLHPNEKPTSVIKRILEHCSYVDSIVLDPFAGSGAVLEACQQVGRRWIGIERDPEFYTRIKERLGIK